jgi:FeS assembly SUF system protein
MSEHDTLTPPTPAAAPTSDPAAEPGTAPPAGTAAEAPPALGATEAPSSGPIATPEELEAAIVEALQSVYDPEIPVNIYELRLIYDIVSDADGRVTVTMTLTSPACPSAQQLPAEAHFKTKAVEGVTDAHVDIVWEPPWSKELMSETAKMALGMF